MDREDALLLAATMMAARATAGQVQGLMADLSEAEKAQLAAASEELMRRLPAVNARIVGSGSLPAIPLPMDQPLPAAIPVGLEERRQGLLARVTTELADVEELLQAARRAGEEVAQNVLLDWRSALAARRSALTAGHPVG